MSSDDQSDRECPLCMEAFDIDDINFFPCNCQYQICRFCWHRIKENENGLCPACRQTYPEDPVNFQPLSSAEVQKIKSEKKQKVQREKNKLIEGRKHLAEFRVLQKNLVYAVGLSQRMADPELLKKPEFFGKFGKIIKVAVGTAQAINNNTPPTHTAYVTYARSEDALRAIEAVNNMVVDGRLLKASLGTTKYCSNFLKGQACYKPECMYLHEVAEGEISFTKDDMHQGKHTEYERRLHEQMSTACNGQHQHNQTAGKENTAKSRARTADEKKRSTTIGSAENLTTKQKQKKATSAGASSSTKTGWSEQKSTRGGSEARELRRNESAKAMLIETKRSSKASVKSVSPPIVNNGRSRTDREGGTSSSHSSNNTTEARNTSPVSMSYSIGEQMSLAGGGRSDSNPPAMASSTSSPSPPSPIVLTEPLTNGISTSSIGSKHSLSDNGQQNQQRQQQQNLPINIPQPVNSNINFFLDHDDDLGFDPFTESAKGLEQMIEEEKHFTPPTNPTNGMTMNREISNTNNSALFTNQHPLPLSGLHQAFSGQNHFDQDSSTTTGFGNMFSSKMHGGSSGNLAMSDLRESFKAMLPNVNVRFMAESNNEGLQHPQQQQMNHQMAQHQFGNDTTIGGGGSNFFGGNDHTSTNSLPSIPSGHPRAQSTVPTNNQFRPFQMDQQQFQQQQRHLQQLPHQIGRQQFQSMSTANSFGGTSSNGPFHQQQLNGPMGGGPAPLHHQQQQSPSPYSNNAVNTSPYQYAQRNGGNSQFNSTTNSPFPQLQHQQSGQHHFGGGMLPPPHHNNFQQGHQQQQFGGGSNNSNGSVMYSDAEQQGCGGTWLPVPPGFQPRTTN